MVTKCIDQLKRKTEGEPRALADIIDNNLQAALSETRAEAGKDTGKYKRAADDLLSALVAIEELFTKEPLMLVRPFNHKYRITNGDQERIDAAFDKSKRAIHDYRTILAPQPILQQLEAERDPAATSASIDAPLESRERRW